MLLLTLIPTIVAHHEAATNGKTRILHCDISGGNILIYPKVRSRKCGKERSLVWTGILSDWEMSKSIDDPNTSSCMSRGGRMVRSRRSTYFTGHS